MPLSSTFIETPEELRARVEALAWFHTIDLGRGVKTRGASEIVLSPEQLVNVSGRTVLDIGAWDGYYSFYAEQHGATRVVALDHYAWGVDIMARTRYWQECAEVGVLPDHGRDDTDFWRPDLPGRRGFDLARQALNSNVEPVVADFTRMDLAPLGTFEVVLYLGVLYHMKEPLTCIERLRAVTTEVAVIETEAVHLQGFDQAPLMQFHAGSEVGADFGNWYVSSIEALKGLCKAAGFSRIEVVTGPPPPPVPARLARRTRPLSQSSAPTANYRAVVHAFV